MINWLRSLFALAYAADEGSGGGDPGGSADDAGATGGNADDADGGKSSSSSNSDKSFPEFHSWFPEEFRGHASFKDGEDWKPLGRIIREYVEMHGTQGSSVEVPGKDATQEQKDAFYRKIGRPEVAGDYALQKPSDWPNNLPWDAQTAARFAQDALASNVPKEIAESLFARLMKRAQNDALGVQDVLNRTLADYDQQLKKEYGDGLDKALVAADRAATLTGPPSFAQLLKDHRIEKHPAMVAHLNTVFHNIDEDKLLGGAANDENLEQTRSEKLKSRYPNTIVP